jgi:hypothetical protein
VLHLPDVAELVRDEVVRDIGAAQEDHEVRREAVESAPGREPEEPRRDDDPDPPDADGAGPPVEPVEARFRADEWCVATYATIGSRTRTAERSCACVYWNW